MLLDFCDHSIHPKIKSDKVSFDGFEVQNLISNIPEKKRNGFLADHFIKPPVNVTVQFPCNVSIYKIVIDPVIGQQKSCDFKIFTACVKMTDSWLYHTSDNTAVNTDGVMFNNVGSVSMIEPTVVCFVNNQFKDRNLWRTEIVPDLNSYPTVTELNARKTGGLCNASHVTVCINRCKNGKSVALKKLEIWGIPSIKVPNPVQITLKNTYLAALKQREVTHKAIPQARNTSTVSRHSGATTTVVDSHSENIKVIIDGVTVPEDFLDQITFEIMTVPVVLPCGKVIDRSTLERYTNSEASWGRQPSDPFTGVVFSQGAGPVSNVSLKARIDQFILKHSESLKIPQTLGHSNAYKARQNATASSKLVHDPSGSKHSVNTNECLSSNATEKIIDLSSDIHSSQFINSNQTDVSNKGYSSERRKRKQPIGEPTSELNFKKLKGVKQQAYIDLTRNDEISLFTNKQVIEASNHNSDLSKSLDSALLSALGGLPSYTRKTSTTSSNNPANKDTMCSKCQSDLRGNESVKYKMTCGHLICRSCLVQEKNSFVCSVCSRQCTSSQAVRVF